MQPIAENRNQDQICFEPWSNWHIKSCYSISLLAWFLDHFLRRWKTLVPCKQRRNWAHVYLVLDEHFEHLNNVLKCYSDTGTCTMLYSKVQIGRESYLGQILKFYTPTSKLTLRIVYRPNINRIGKNMHG